MEKKAIILLAEGFEEVEAITPADYLRRAGIEVLVAAMGGNRSVKGSHGLSFQADTTLAELLRSQSASNWDLVVVPGGMPGAANIAASVSAGALLKEQYAAGRLVAAICAAPVVVLHPLGLIAGRRYTCFPGMEKGVTGAHWSSDPVVVDGNVITSRAAGTAGTWAIAIIEVLAGSESARRIAASLLIS